MWAHFQLYLGTIRKMTDFPLMEENLAECYRQCKYNVQYNTVQVAEGWLIQYWVDWYPSNGLNIVITTLLATGTMNISLQCQMTMTVASFILQSFLFTKCGHRHREPSHRSQKNLSTRTPMLGYRYHQLIEYRSWPSRMLHMFSATHQNALKAFLGHFRHFYFFPLWPPPSPNYWNF